MRYPEGYEPYENLNRDEIWKMLKKFWEETTCLFSGSPLTLGHLVRQSVIDSINECTGEI
jgi:hypothetical protein